MMVIKERFVGPRNLSNADFPTSVSTSDSNESSYSSSYYNRRKNRGKNYITKKQVVQVIRLTIIFTLIIVPTSVNTIR